MNRARLIINEVTISRAGEIYFFQIRLPKNSQKIIGIDTDTMLVTAVSALKGKDAGSANGRDMSLPPSSADTVAAARLRLFSRDKHKVFYAGWLKMPVAAPTLGPVKPGGPFVTSQSLAGASMPGRVAIPCSGHVLHACLVDEIGARRQIDITYTVWVSVWVQTSEPNGGVIYEFETPTQQ